MLRAAAVSPLHTHAYFQVPFRFVTHIKTHGHIRVLHEVMRREDTVVRFDDNVRHFR